jgi:hypothetical protein
MLRILWCEWSRILINPIGVPLLPFVPWFLKATSHIPRRQSSAPSFQDLAVKVSIVYTDCFLKSSGFTLAIYCVVLIALNSVTR